MIFNSKYNIFLLAALLLAVGHSAIFPVQFCWRQFYRREPVAKARCQAGKNLHGFKCYEACPSHMPMTQFDCINPACPRGLTSQKISCTQTYNRVYSWPRGSTVQQDQKSKASCETFFGSGKCVGQPLSWLPKCKDGFKSWSKNSCKNTKLDCQAYGFKHYPFTGQSCPKQRLYIASSSLVCPAGTINYGLSCYKPCWNGYVGAGPYCWKQLQQGKGICGVASANAQSCVYSVTRITNVTLAFNLASECMLLFEELILLQSNSTAYKQGILALRKNLQTAFAVFYTQFYSPSKPNDLLQFMAGKLKFADSIDAMAYILDAQDDAPYSQLLQFMGQFVSLFSQLEVTRMLIATPWATCQ